MENTAGSAAVTAVASEAEDEKWQQTWRGWLGAAAAAGASDLHISPGMPPLLRVNGQLRSLLPEARSGERLDALRAMGLLAALMTPDQQAAFEAGNDLDFGCDFELDPSHPPHHTQVRLRINAFRQRHGPAAALRLVPTAPRCLAEVAPEPIAEVLRSWALLPQGLILCTGATGSGKSTTLAAMVDHRNRHSAGHILTIEDPIECLHESRLGLVSQREVGSHAQGFEQALRSALREDPDVILVGELRDLATIRLALTAAETGHLVLATLHTGGAEQAASRLIDAFAHEEQATVRTMLSQSLQGVVTQVLCRHRSGRGRVAAFELLRATPAVRHLIREDKPAQVVSVMQSGLKQGMQTLDQHLHSLVQQRAISAEEARLHARQPENFT